jgi:putative protease
LYVRIALDKPLHMGDGIEIYDEEKGILSIIVTDIMQNGSHSRLAEPGESPWVGDIKTSVKKGSMVYRTMSRPLFDEARKTYERGEAAIIPVDMHFRLKTGEPAVLKVSDGCSDIVVKSEINAEKALNKPLSAERTKEQLQKTGDTPYRVRNIEIDTDGVSTIPVSVLNALRRSALETMSSRRIELHKKALSGRKQEPVIKAEPGNNVGAGSNIVSGNKLALSAYFYEMPEELSRLNGLVKRVYLPSAPVKNLERMRNEFTGELFLWTPSILKDTELTQLMKRLTEVSDLWDGLAYGNGGFLPAFKEAFPEKQFCADYTVNIFNDEALALQKELGAKTGTLSPELRLSEVETFLDSGLELEAIVYGRIPLMTMEHCPASMESECSGLCASCSSRKGTLKDRKEEAFPFARDPVLRVTRIFNAMPMLMDDTTALGKTGLSLLRLTFTDEDKETCENVARHYYNKLRGAADDPKVTEIIQKIKDQGFTKRHWFRGV